MAAQEPVRQNPPGHVLCQVTARGTFSFFLMGVVSTNQIRLLVHSGVLSVLL